MLNMENAEEVMQILERFTRLKQKEIPKELDDYMNYVAKTGDTVFKWSSLKYLFREKLLNVIKNFHDTSPRVDDLPQYPNVDPFNYESMKSSLLERLELFNAAPFTIQRLCELLTEPRKQYSRIDKFMRALEKNILVVSTIEPGRKRTESENGDSLDSVVNGDASLDVNVDIDMENEPIFNAEPPNATSSTNPSSQPSSNLIHKADDDILPNPKKPKLDLSETADAETEAATKSITSNKTETAEASASVEKVILDESADITDKKKKEERVAEEKTVSEEKPTAINATATAEVAVVVDAKKDVKDSECEKMEEDSPTTAAPTAENNNVDGKKEEAEEKAEPVITSKPAEVVVVDKVSPLASTPEVVAAVEAIKTTENPEKIDDVPEGTNKDCAEKVVDKQEPAKDIEAEKVMKVNDDDKENHNGDIKEKKEKTEPTIITSTSEKIDDTKSESAPEETIAAKKEEKSEEVVKEKVEEVVAVPVAVVIEDSKKEVDGTLKTGVVPSVMSEEPSKPEEAKPAAEDVIVTAAEAVSVPVEEIKETITSNTADPIAKIVAADPPPSATESLQKESPETPVEVKPSELKEIEAGKTAEITVATAAPSTESKAGSVTVPVPVVAAEPVVTVDQPMEENPETIAEPVVPTIVVEAAANVEEIEMATDVIEPAKDEPAGMEVDDTSQEAMDQ